MALLLDDIFQEMRLALVQDLNAKCETTDALVTLYTKYKDANEPPVFDINNGAQLVTLINQYGMTASDIAKLVQNGTNYVTRNELSGAVEATSTEGLKAKVMSKAGKHLAELIRDPQSNRELYNKCVGGILAPYIETLSTQK